MFTKAFWVDLAERTVATMAENAVSVLVIAGTALLDTDWKGVASTVGIAGVLTVLKGLAASQVGTGTTASFLDVPGRHEAPTR